MSNPILDSQYASPITVTDMENIPTDYDWVYVVKSDGTISDGYRWRGP